MMPLKRYLPPAIKEQLDDIENIDNEISSLATIRMTPKAPEQ